MEEFFQISDDIAIDVPEVYRYTAILFTPIVIDGGLSLSQLSTCASPLSASTSLKPPGPVFISEILNEIKSLTDTEFLSKLYQEAKSKDNFDLRQFWPTNRRSEDVLADWFEAPAQSSLSYLEPAMKVGKPLKVSLSKNEGIQAIETLVDVNYLFLFYFLNLRSFFLSFVLKILNQFSLFLFCLLFIPNFKSKHIGIIGPRNPKIT